MPSRRAPSRAVRGRRGPRDRAPSPRKPSRDVPRRRAPSRRAPRLHLPSGRKPRPHASNRAASRRPSPRRVPSRRPSTSRRSPATSPAWSNRAAGARRLSQAARGRPRQPGRAPTSSPTRSRRSATSLQYWLADPQRALRHAHLPRHVLPRSVGQHGQAHGRRSSRRRSPRPIRATSASPIPSGRRTSSSTSSSRAICSPAHWAEPPGARRRRARSARAAEGRFLHAADRQRARAVEFRAHQSRAACARRSPPTPRTSSRGMRMLAEDIEAGGGRLKIRQSDSLDVRGRPQSRASRPAR